MAVKVVNLEAGMPRADMAMQRLSQELRIARANRQRAIKIIHGYGSCGEGGAIKKAARELLVKRRREGSVKAFIPGEEFHVGSVCANEAVAYCQELRRDIDFNRQNDGVTIVLF